MKNYLMSFLNQQMKLQIQLTFGNKVASDTIAKYNQLKQ